MIRLLDDYVIQCGPYDYMLAKDTGRLDKKTGEPVLKPISYHGSVQKAIVALREHCKGKVSAGKVMELSEAIDALNAVDRRFRRLLESRFSEEET